MPQRDPQILCAISIVYIPIPIFERIKTISDKLQKKPDQVIEEVIEGIFSEGSKFDLDRYIDLILHEPESDEIKFFGRLSKDEVKTMRLMKTPKTHEEIQNSMKAEMGSAREFIFKLESLGFKIHRQFYKELMEFKFNIEKLPKETK